MAKKITRTFDENVGFKVRYAVYENGEFTAYEEVIGLTSPKDNVAEVARECFGENICIMSVTPCKFVAKQSLRFFIAHSEICFSDEVTEEETNK